MSASSRPYLIRALYEWLVDNQLTPQLLVNPQHQGVHLPPNLINEKQLVLNISPAACRNLHLTNEAVSFSARFSGVAEDIYLPTPAVLAVFAQENSQGMAFGQEPELTPEEVVSAPADKEEVSKPTKLKSKSSQPAASHLTLIK